MTKKQLKSLIKVVISLGLMYLVLNSLDLSKLVGSLESLNFSYYPLIFFLVVSNYLVSSMRWKYLLSIFQEGKDISLSYLVRLYFEGAFISNFLPTSIGGDVYKSYTLGRKLNDQSRAFGATFMERFSGVLVLGFLALFGLVKIYKQVGVVIFVVFMLGITSFFFVFKRISTRFTKLQTFYQALAVYLSYKKILGLSILASVLVQVFSILTQHLIFMSLGVSLPVAFSFFAFPVIILASFIIPSQNSLGVQDLLYASMFSTVGVSVELAVSASLVYHAVRMLVSLLGGFSYAVKK